MVTDSESAAQLSELEHPYASLSPDEREELLRGLLIAASRGEQAVLEVLEASLLACAVDG
jgi:hypothetical protein